MRRKLTITVSEKIYEGLYRTVGPRRISQFIEELVRPHAIISNDASNKAPGPRSGGAADEQRRAAISERSPCEVPRPGPRSFK